MLATVAGAGAEPLQGVAGLLGLEAPTPSGPGECLLPGVGALRAARSWLWSFRACLLPALGPLREHVGLRCIHTSVLASVPLLTGDRVTSLPWWSSWIQCKAGACHGWGRGSAQLGAGGRGAPLLSGGCAAPAALSANNGHHPSTLTPGPWATCVPRSSLSLGTWLPNGGMECGAGALLSSGWGAWQGGRRGSYLSTLSSGASTCMLLVEAARRLQPSRDACLLQVGSQASDARSVV